jgi:hypothetical protein
MATRSHLQKVPVTSSPPGATVIVDGKTQGQTPLELRLFRRRKGQVIRIESPGYNPVEIRVKRSLASDPVVWDNILGLVLGLAACSFWNLSSDSQPTALRMLVTVPVAIGVLWAGDIIDGAVYDLEPENLTVTLTKAHGPSQVEVLRIDAAALRRVKWISVRAD